MNYIQESGFFLLEDLEVVDLPDWVDIGYESFVLINVRYFASRPIPHHIFFWSLENK